MKVWTVTWLKCLSVRGESTSPKVKKTCRPSEKVFFSLCWFWTIQNSCMAQVSRRLTADPEDERNLFLRHIYILLCYSHCSLSAKKDDACVKMWKFKSGTNGYIKKKFKKIIIWNTIHSAIIWPHAPRMQISHRGCYFFPLFWVVWFVCKCCSSSSLPVLLILFSFETHREQNNWKTQIAEWLRTEVKLQLV